MGYATGIAMISNSFWLGCSVMFAFVLMIWALIAPLLIGEM